MFGFLNPLFLFAAASVLIPIVLHLFQARRTVKLPFSTIRFLKLAQQNASRRIRMEHFLLWLLRILLLLAISLAFAMPMLRAKGAGGFLRRSQRDVAIVLDVSYSMNYTTGSGTVWDRAVRSAVAILDGLKPGDRVCLFAAEEEAKPIVKLLSQEMEIADASVRALKPGFFSSRLAPAVLAANDALMEETRRREREIHILTDNQRLPWKSFGNRPLREEGGASPRDEDAFVDGDGWDPSVVDDKTAVFVTLLGVPAPENTSPVDVDIVPKLLMADTPARVTAFLARSGPPESASVSVFMNDRELASRSTPAGANRAMPIPFAIPPLPPGMHPGRIQTPLDNLPLDNAFHFLLKARDRLPALCVGRGGDTLFLMKALTVAAPDLPTLDVRRIDPEETGGETFADYSCMFLCNAIPLPGQDVLRIERYVRAGGFLVVFPGDRGSVADYEAWGCLPARPLRLEDVPTKDRKTTLRWNDPTHPLLRELAAEAGGFPQVTMRRRAVFGDLDKDARVVVTAGADTPFVLERDVGQGGVLFVNASADRAWSSFPLSPFYLPLAREIAQHGAALGAFPPFVWSARSLALRDCLPFATRESALQGPDGNNVPIRTAVIGNDTVLHADDLSAPGIYTMLDDTGARIPALAVNVRREESDLTPVDPANIPDITGLKNCYVAESLEDLAKQIEEHRVGRTLGEWLLWLVLILATLEFCYANYLSQKTPKLSEALGIAASGKVRG